MMIFITYMLDLQNLLNRKVLIL